MLTYRQLIVISVLLCLQLVLGGSVPASSFADSISLAAGESGRLSSGILVHVISIRDSRCPANAMCIWAGQVEVNLILSKDTESHSIDLTLRLGQQIGLNKVTFGTVAYEVRLQDVQPYPGIGFNQAKKATVQVIPM